MFDAAGNTYGTTTSGGKFGEFGNGTVYELVVPVGTGGYTEKVLWSFNGTDGFMPGSSLILDAAGNVYGTTGSGGSSYKDVVFEMNLSGKTTTTTLTSSLNSVHLWRRGDLDCGCHSCAARWGKPSRS